MNKNDHMQNLFRILNNPWQQALCKWPLIIVLLQVHAILPSFFPLTILQCNVPSKHSEFLHHTEVGVHRSSPAKLFWKMSQNSQEYIYVEIFFLAKCCRTQGSIFTVKDLHWRFFPHNFEKSLENIFYRTPRINV